MGSSPLRRVVLSWSVLRRVPLGLGFSQESHPPQVSLRDVRVSCGPLSRLQLGGYLPLTRRKLLGQKLAAQKTYKPAKAMF